MDSNSLSHTKWNCKYHIVFAPKTKYMTSEGDRYYENDKATAFARYYVNGLSFIGILSKDEGDFTLEDLLKSEPEYDEVQCKMPKLNFETSATLNDMLSDLGLENIFSDKTDFSGISEQSTKVDTILQKTKRELDQNGTKAAAGIKLFGGVSGDADEAVEAFINETLEYNPNVKCSHHEHNHGEGHTCGEHGCGSHSCH